MIFAVMKGGAHDGTGVRMDEVDQVCLVSGSHYILYKKTEKRGMATPDNGGDKLPAIQYEFDSYVKDPSALGLEPRNVRVEIIMN